MGKVGTNFDYIIRDAHVCARGYEKYFRSESDAEAQWSLGSTFVSVMI